MVFFPGIEPHTDRKRPAVGAEMLTFSKNGMSRATYVWNKSYVS